MTEIDITPEERATAEIVGRAAALLSGLKVGRMPDGKHFNSDINAAIAWYAQRLTAASPEEERRACPRYMAEERGKYCEYPECSCVFPATPLANAAAQMAERMRRLRRCWPGLNWRRRI